MTFWDETQAAKDNQEKVRLLYENLLENHVHYMANLSTDARQAKDGIDTGIVLPGKTWSDVDYDHPLILPSNGITIVTSRTGGGKTTLLANLAARLALRGYTGFYLTLEEAGFQINARIMAAYTSLIEPNTSATWMQFRDCLNMIRNENKEALNWDKLQDYTTKILDRVRVLDANKSVDVDKVCTPSVLYQPQFLANIIQYRNAKCSEPLDFVIIDYVQLMGPDDGGDAWAKRYERIGDVMQALKNLSSSLGIAVIAGAQMNRQAVGLSVWEWEREFIREGADIEQSTALMIGIGRDAEEPDPERQMAIRIMKNRFGNDRAGGMFKVDFACNAICDKGVLAHGYF